IDRWALLVQHRQGRDAGRTSRCVTLEAISGSLEQALEVVWHHPREVLRRAFERALRAGLVALSFHRALVSSAIDGDVLCGCRVFDEIVRQPERVVEAERGLASNDALWALE